ncbi:factor activating pos9 [Coemansia javaensis]|uniref:Adenylate kinase isoenzyme 6 homolog n=1 Tax=Coemansia javaensis TaxID=2761396 RepID=A0A9W8HDK1_9FUNG|nr:factor activating pos9 [Coemansia javaensis]
MSGGGSVVPTSPPRSSPNILVTGTPGTGKTTTAEMVALAAGLEKVTVGELVKERGLHDGYNDEFDTYWLNEDKVVDEMEEMMAGGGMCVDFHTCGFFPERWFDLVVVLRAETNNIYDRLEGRGYKQNKIQENVECEIMQVVLDEARESYKADIVMELPSNTVEDMEANVDKIVAFVEHPPAEASPVQAQLPRLSPEFVAEHYPAGVGVVHVDLLHRHGERTPLAHYIPGAMPRHWNFCARGNRLHRDFLRALDLHTGSSGNDEQWRPTIFEKDRGGGRGPSFLFAGGPAVQDPGDVTRSSEATCGFGQLTDVGRQSMTALGAHMRALYVDALGVLPAAVQPGSSDAVRLRSTAQTRAVESLLHTLGGLYPDAAGDGPLFRVGVRPPGRESLVPDFGCAAMVREYTRLNALARDRHSAEHEALCRDVLAIPALRSFFSGQLRDFRPHAATSLMDALAPMRAHGLPLPDGVDDALLARIVRLAATEVLYSGRMSAALARLQAGQLLHEISGNMAHAVAADRASNKGGPGRPQLSIYSGHDTTLAPLLAAFCHDPAQPAPHTAPIGFSWPAYASSMRIELLRDTAAPAPAIQPGWAQDQAETAPDPAQIPPARRIRPAGVPASLGARGYYVRVWHDDRAVVLPACRDPGAHHTRLGPAVCTLDGFFAQIARFAATPGESRRECCRPPAEPSRPARDAVH